MCTHCNAFEDIVSGFKLPRGGWEARLNLCFPPDQSSSSYTHVSRANHIKKTASPMVNTKPILVKEAKEIDQRIEDLNLALLRAWSGPRVSSMLISVLISILTDGIEAREGQPLYVSGPSLNTVPYKKRKPQGTPQSIAGPHVMQTLGGDHVLLLGISLSASHSTSETERLLGPTTNTYQ